MANHNTADSRIKREHFALTETTPRPAETDMNTDLPVEAVSCQLDDVPADAWYQTEDDTCEPAEVQFRRAAEGQGQAGGVSVVRTFGTTRGVDQRSVGLVLD